MSKIKLAGKSISEILKRIKRAQRNKRATKNQERAGLSVKSIKPWNYRAGARDEQIVPIKKQSQKGSSFQPHKVRGKQGAASIRETSEGSAASWRDEMDKYFGDLRPSKFFKKASGGDINTGMKKLSPKQKAIAAKAPPPDKIDAKDFAVLKAEKAKGRGMGLQDEKIKPGKVMTANKGKEIKADPTKTITDKGQFVKRRMKLTGSKLPGRIGTALGIGSMLVPAAYAAAKQYKDYKSAKNRDKAKVKKMGGGMMRRYSSGAMAEDRAMEGRKAAYKKMGFEAMMKSGEIKFPGQDKKRTRENPMKEERFQRTRQSQIAKVVGKENVSDPRKVERKMVGGMAKKYSVGGGADASRKTFPSMAAMREAKGFKPGETPAQFNKRRMMLEGAKKAAKATRIGKIAAGVGAVGVAASQFLKKKMEEKKENKKMGGGMMNKPMGYKKGVMVKARGCKLGRTRPTKIT